MTREDLIANCNMHIGAAYGCAQLNDHTHYAEHMHLLLDLLLEELVGDPPAAPGDPHKPFNPERVLTEIAIAIKHRTISTSLRWKIIYYHTRLTCVPIESDVPEHIVLHTFSESMVNRGFTAIYWNQLKQNVVKFYKELHK